MELAESRPAAWGQVFLKLPADRVDGRNMAVSRSTGTDFRKRIHSFVSVEIKVQKLGEDIEVLDFGKVPSGYKPYKLNFENAAWDESSSLGGTTQ